MKNFDDEATLEHKAVKPKFTINNFQLHKVFFHKRSFDNTLLGSSVELVIQLSPDSNQNKYP